MSWQPPSGDEPPDPALPEPPAIPESPEPPTAAQPDTETARVPWESAPAQSAPPAPEPSSGWVTTAEPSGGGLVKACLIIALIGVGLFLFMIVALIFIGSQVSDILRDAGNSV